MKTRVLTIRKKTKVVRVSEILKDIISDMDDEELLEKYHLTWTQLGKIYSKLFHGGFLETRQMLRRIELRLGRNSSHIPFAEMPSYKSYKCRLCGFRSRLHFTACPKCGEINLRRLTARVLDDSASAGTGGYQPVVY